MNIERWEEVDINRERGKASKGQEMEERCPKLRRVGVNGYHRRQPPFILS